MGKNDRGVLIISRDVFAEIFEYLIKEKVSGTKKFAIVSMKKIKYSDNIEVEIDFNHTPGLHMDTSGRFELGQLLGRNEIDPSEAFKRSRKIGNKIEEMVPKKIPIPVKLAKSSDTEKNMILGLAIEDCKKGDMISIVTDGAIWTDSSDAVLPGEVSGKVTTFFPKINKSGKFTKPKKKKIKKDFNIKAFDHDHETPF